MLHPAACCSRIGRDDVGSVLCVCCCIYMLGLPRASCARRVCSIECSPLTARCGTKTKQKYLVSGMISIKDRKRRNGELEQSINKAKKEKMGKNAKKCSSGHKEETSN